MFQRQAGPARSSLPRVFSSVFTPGGIGRTVLLAAPLNRCRHDRLLGRYCGTIWPGESGVPKLPHNTAMKLTSAVDWLNDWAHGEIKHARLSLRLERRRSQLMAWPLAAVQGEPGFHRFPW